MLCRILKRRLGVVYADELGLLTGGRDGRLRRRWGVGCGGIRRARIRRLLSCLGCLRRRGQRILKVVSLPTGQIKVFVAASHVGQFRFRHDTQYRPRRIVPGGEGRIASAPSLLPALVGVDVERCDGVKSRNGFRGGCGSGYPRRPR